MRQIVNLNESPTWNAHTKWVCTNAVSRSRSSRFDLILLQYATERGFRIEENESWLIFADGTTTRTCGIFRVQLAAGFGAKKLASTVLPPADPLLDDSASIELGHPISSDGGV